MITGILSVGIIGVATSVELLGNLNTSPQGSSSAPLLPDQPKEGVSEQHQGLIHSPDPQLRLLATYEQRLGRGFSHVMRFSDMPIPGDEISEPATRMASVLKEHARQGVTPVVVFEPERLDLRSIDRDTFEEYFMTIKEQGVSSQEIGTWIPFPEPNIPEWGHPHADFGNTDPKLFVKNFSIVAAALKKVFPEAQTVLLLDSATYSSYDIDYTQGSYDKAKLLQYTKGLDPALVNAIGLQGFPWGEQGGQLNYDPAVFLDADLAIAVARQLGVEKVWLNSGTFSTMYGWDPDLRVTVSDSKRGRILTGIAKQAEQIQRAGLGVTVNIFAEDKTSTEANWSYMSASSWKVLQDFTHLVEEKGIGLVLFDMPKTE